MLQSDYKAEWLAKLAQRHKRQAEPHDIDLRLSSMQLYERKSFYLHRSHWFLHVKWFCQLDLKNGGLYKVRLWEQRRGKGRLYIFEIYKCIWKAIEFNRKGKHRSLFQLFILNQGLVVTYDQDNSPKSLLHAMFTLCEIKTIIEGAPEVCKTIAKIHLAAFVRIKNEKS